MHLEINTNSNKSGFANVIILAAIFKAPTTNSSQPKVFTMGIKRLNFGISFLKSAAEMLSAGTDDSFLEYLLESDALSLH